MAPSTNVNSRSRYAYRFWGVCVRAIVARRPPPGLVHHSDRGAQHASVEYVAILTAHGMVPSMSRPANPYDNASCESFIKTLKRGGIYANDYSTLKHLRNQVEEFSEQYCNRQRSPPTLSQVPAGSIGDSLCED